MMNIPDGYALIRKGGRPSKLDRDIGVMLMRYLLKDIRRGKAAAVDQAVVEYFSLTDAAAMRTIIRGVKKKFGPEWTVLQVATDALMLGRVVPVPERVTADAAKQALKKCWLWGEDFTSAMQLSGGQGKGMQPTNLKKWSSFKR